MTGRRKEGKRERKEEMMKKISRGQLGKYWNDIKEGKEGITEWKRGRIKV